MKYASASNDPAHPEDRITRSLAEALSLHSFSVLNHCDGHVQTGTQTPWVEIQCMRDRSVRERLVRLLDGFYQSRPLSSSLLGMRIVDINEGESLVLTSSIRRYLDPVSWAQSLTPDEIVSIQHDLFVSQEEMQSFEVYVRGLTPFRHR